MKKLIFITVILVVVLDQLSKALIIANFAQGEYLTVVPGIFNLTLTFNRGAAFGMMAGLPDGVRELSLSLATMLALGVVIYLFRHRDYQSTLPQAALAMIFGGALGNVVDRMRMGMVTDFLDFYYAEWHWPAFNLADSCITVGVALLLLYKPRNLSSSQETSKI